MPYFVHGCGLICVRKKYTDLLLWHLVRTFSVSMLEVVLCYKYKAICHVTHLANFLVG